MRRQFKGGLYRDRYARAYTAPITSLLYARIIRFGEQSKRAIMAECTSPNQLVPRVELTLSQCSTLEESCSQEDAEAIDMKMDDQGKSYIEVSSVRRVEWCALFREVAQNGRGKRYEQVHSL